MPRISATVRSILRQGEVEENIIQDYRLVAPRIFNALVFNQMLDTDLMPRRLTGENPALLPYEKKDLDLYNYKLYSMKALNKALMRDIKLLLKHA